MVCFSNSLHFRNWLSLNKRLNGHAVLIIYRISLKRLDLFPVFLYSTVGLELLDIYIGLICYFDIITRLIFWQLLHYRFCSVRRRRCENGRIVLAPVVDYKNSFVVLQQTFLHYAISKEHITCLSENVYKAIYQYFKISFSLRLCC